MKEQINNKLAVSSQVIFWGSLWGITEATLGYFAHLLVPLPGIVGFLFFPLGLYFMMRAYDLTGQVGVIFGTASVAASIKLLDLFLPGLNPIYTLNPAVSILLEGLVVFIAVGLMQRAHKKFSDWRFSDFLLISGIWRIGFLAYSLVLYCFAVSPLLVQAGTVVLARFVLLESLVNAFIITVFVKVKAPWTAFAFLTNRLKPIWVAFVFSGAVVLQIVLASV